MNMNQTFALLFWQTKSRTSNGLCMVYARLTINGRRIEISTNRKIQEKLWNAKLQKAQGVSMEAKSLNNHIEAMRSSLYQHHSRLVTIGKTVTPLLLKNEFLGISDDRKSLQEAFDFLLRLYRDKVNIGKTSCTMQQWECKIALSLYGNVPHG